MSDEEESKATKFVTELPERCPICNTKKSNILLHIRTRELCYQKVDKQIFDEWRKLARKETKRKSQTKFNQRGGHNKARKRKAEKEKELKSLKRSIDHQKSIVKKKTKIFIRLAGECLLYLSQGKTPRAYSIKYGDFDLIVADYSTIKDGIYERKCLLNEKELHAWMNGINSKLLKAVMTLRNVVLISESDWDIAINAVEEISDKENLKDKLFTLIGKLQAYDNDNTKNVLVPEKYKSRCIESTVWKENYNCWANNIFIKEDQMKTLTFIEDILGNNLCLIDNEVQDLLKIREDMDNLNFVLGYAKHDL